VLKKDNNTNLLAGDQILLVISLAHSLFNQIIVRFNGTLISPQTDTCYHKAFIEHILNNDRADGENLLAPQGWFNSLNVPDTADTALTVRRIISIQLIMIIRHCQKTPKFPCGIEFSTWVEKKVTLRFKPFLPSQQVIDPGCTDPDANVL